MPTTYQLSGRIYDQHSQPVAGVTVKAFDQDLNTRRTRWVHRPITNEKVRCN